MKKVFIDADIILDLLARREPFYEHSAKLFSLVDKGNIQAYTSPIIITNIHYILSKLLNKKQSLKNIHKLTALIRILAVDEKTIKLALSSDFNDFEDAIQYYTAIENNINFLITRNIKDYKTAKISILTAEEYLHLYKSRKNEAGHKEHLLNHPV